MDVGALLKDWNGRGSLVTVGGHRLFVSEYGDPSLPPLLLLHGFPTASFDYARLVPLLSGRRRLILFDFLGFGLSDKPRPHRYSLFEQAALAEELLASRGITETDLMAHDMGTSVALLLLQRARLRVPRVILLNGSLLLRYYQPLISQRLLLHPFTGPLLTRLGLINRALFARQFSRLFPTPPDDAELDAFWSLITHNDGAHIYHLLIEYLNERKRYDESWLDSLAGHKSPLLLLWGQRDPVSVPRIAEAVVERRPDATLIRLPELGHYPQWEAPERIARHTLDFLPPAT